MLIVTRGLGKGSAKIPVVAGGGGIVRFEGVEQRLHVTVNKLSTKDSPDTKQLLKVKVESVNDWTLSTVEKNIYF